LGRAVIAQPVVLNAPLLLPRTNERGHGGLSRFGQTFRLYQKEFAFSKLEKGPATFQIRASAEHLLPYLLLGDEHTRRATGFQINSTFTATEFSSRLNEFPQT